MSVDVMYQPYMHSPYFGTSYQRAVSTSTDPFKKFGSATLKMHDGLFDSGTYSSSFSAPSATSSAPAAAGSAAAAAAAAGIKAEEDHLDKDNQPQTTQYLNPSCVIFTYFSGDIASNVDDHFSRSLSDTQGSSKGGSPSWKDSNITPMTSRNFPPSFWNCNPQPAAVHTDFSSLHASADPYMAASGLHGMTTALAAQDPWRYPLSTQTAAHSASAHHSMHDALAYSSMAAASGSRFQSHYSSLLPTTSRLTGQCDLSKHSAADSWSSRYHPSSDLSHTLAAPTAHHDTTSHLHTAATLTGGGIDSTIVADMNGAKDVRSDPYWY